MRDLESFHFGAAEPPVFSRKMETKYEWSYLEGVYRPVLEVAHILLLTYYWLELRNS